MSCRKSPCKEEEAFFVSERSKLRTEIDLPIVCSERFGNICERSSLDTPTNGMKSTECPLFTKLENRVRRNSAFTSSGTSFSASSKLKVPRPNPPPSKMSREGLPDE